MPKAMASRERMLCAIEGKAADYVPLSFMIFSACERRCGGPLDFFLRQKELGLDAVVELWRLNADEVKDCGDAPGPPVAFGPEVKVREWREAPAGERYPLLHKEYQTPHGTLTTTVQQTDDWRLGDHVPFLDDYVEARSTKPLVTCFDDLPPLRFLLAPPRMHELARTRQLWATGIRFAQENELLSAAGWSVGGDALAWLCGLQASVMMAMDQPELLEGVLDAVGDWNRWRMEVMLDAKPDLLVRRGWYEGTDFWSPALYRRFLLPRLAAEVRMAHQAGAKFGYILTSGAMPLLDMIIGAGVDVLIGVDPIQGKGTDMAEMKRRTKGHLALWGGVNGFITVERGTPQGIREAVRLALDTLGPDGFILSPVDNIRDTSEEVWERAMVMIEAWKEIR